ncbi:hypothetical protein RN001_005667 [Aquatica leii]|uniref:Ketoreductase domain-containing protein n=1 Tax=Aquatica leii TaxID=1421715 RepID=A0AAN7QKH0_9COLE|nr:hypothetical protein RN001_005667 [Aquatica leii]
MIATSTPEKDAIAEREKGKISSARIKSVTRKIVQSSDESSEEGDNEMELQGSDTSEQFIQELLDVDENEGFGDLEREPNEGDYVLVEFTAQRKKKYFILVKLSPQRTKMMNLKLISSGKVKNMQFAGKVILITGASSGIGAATAQRFAALGASLALTGRNVENLNKVAAECTSVNKHKPLLLTGEFANESDIKTIFDSVIKHYGKLDVLVNNAGILETGSIETTNLEQYDRVMNINVRSVYYLTTLAVPYLIASKGNIVNVSSVNGIRSFPNVLAYCMSKACIDQFTRCTALELALKQVRVNSVNPGVIITSIHQRGGMNDQQYQEFLARTKSTHALGRPGLASEVASTITFLASDDASNITGASIPVDGGRHAICPR